MITSLIVAVSENHVIGKDNALPWRLPADLAYFKKITNGHHIIMGRKTFESLGKSLPNRTNVVISRNPDFQAEGCICVHSIEAALEIALANKETEAFVIGGAEIFTKALPLAQKVYYTQVMAVVEGDTFFEALNPEIWKLSSSAPYMADEKNAFAYDFKVYVRR